MSDLTSKEMEDLTQIAKVLRRGNYYEALSITTNATREDVQKAYYDLARRYHPDRYHRRDIEGAEDLVEEVFAGINKAFHTLRNKGGRSRHDSELKRKGLFDIIGMGETSVDGASHTVAFDQTEDHEPLVHEPPPEDEPAAKEAPKKKKKKKKKVGLGGGHEIGFEGGEETEVAQKKRKRRERVKKRKKASKGRGATKHVAELKRRLVEKLAKARRYYRTGLEDMEGERWIKAAGAIYLAMQFDERNEEYKKLYLEVKVKADTLKAAQYIAIAENAESYRNIREAVVNYQKAVAYDPQDGTAFFRLAQLLQVYEDDPRGALANYRQAAGKEPRNARYRMALADLYAQLDMRANAHREYLQVLKLDPKNAEAKTGARRNRA